MVTRSDLIGLPDRGLQPPQISVEANPIVYHYCSVGSFLKIIESKKLWLSDINTLNDYSEVHWAYDRFIEAANEVLPKVGKEFIGKLDAIVSSAQLRALPLVSSFSKDGDVLSQWRSYANDGGGVAVGFDSTALKNLPVRTVDVVYDQDFQVKYFKQQILGIKEQMTSIKAKLRDAYIEQRAILLALDLACFKNPAFAEEKEIRLIRIVGVENNTPNWRLVDDLWGEQGAQDAIRPIQFRSKGNGVVAYITLGLPEDNRNVIREVIVGPKSECNGIEISMALNAVGFSDAVVKHSKATYR